MVRWGSPVQIRSKALFYLFDNKELNPRIYIIRMAKNGLGTFLGTFSKT